MTRHDSFIHLLSNLYPTEMDANHMEKQCRESDKSSNISELKLEMRTGSSASNINCESDYGGGRDSDSIITRVAIPLAGLVPIEQQYVSNRFSSTGESIDSMFEAKVIYYFHFRQMRIRDVDLW